MSDLEPVEQWFARQQWTPLAYQRQTWAAYLDGRSGLVHAATGTGKTLAALGGPLAEGLSEGLSKAPPLRLLWVTPLRALATDTTAHIQAAIDALGLAWSVEKRTQDTSSTVKTRQRRKPPTILVTTPESLALLLSYADATTVFRQLQAVIVDEWHELLGSKRGVHLELCLARLRSTTPALRTWGLSATLGNLDQAMAVLLAGAEGVRISGDTPKELTIDALIPEAMERFPWVGHLGLALLPRVIDELERASTSLLFTNTRGQAERWYRGLTVLRPDWAGSIALHHGSLDRGIRAEVEDRLRAGSLRCVVATSSLDLGVDFSPVEQVIQVGSPKGVGRLIQRAGRSGHQPGRSSRVLCVPTHAVELVEIAAVRRAAADGVVEARRPLRHCLDVLVQHLVSCAVGGGFQAEALQREVLATHAFADLRDDEWRWCLDFISRGGDALQHYPQFQRVLAQNDIYWVDSTAIARRHRLAIGTIVSSSLLWVKFLKGGSLGSIDESFITRLKPRDRFIFAGRLLELARIKDMTAYVRMARGRSERVPRWVGARLPFSGELAAGLQALLSEAREGVLIEPELQALAPILAVQQCWSALPGNDELLVEQLRTREGHHLFIYPFAGRHVHEGLGALLAQRLSQGGPTTFSIAVNDYGLELLSPTPLTVDQARLHAVLHPDGLLDDLLAALNVSEMAKRQFRDIARISGLVFSGYPGSSKGGQQLQASSGLIYDVLTRFDADNRLLAQAEAEVLERQLEAGRLQTLLIDLQGRRIRLTHPPRLTPLAFPLWSERMQFQVSTEDWKTRVQRMVVVLERAADEKSAV